MKNYPEIMSVAEVEVATMAELLICYNANAETATKRFSSIAAGRKRVAALMSGNKKAPAKKAAAKRVATKKVPSKKSATKKLSAPTKKKSGDTAAEAKARTSAIKRGFGPRGVGISVSWVRPEVAATRAERNGVSVGGVEYKSVAAAYRELEMDLAGHIKFRMTLKKLGKITDDEGRKWKLL